MKNNFILQFMLTLVLATIAQLFLPWWSLVVVAAAVGLCFKNKDVLSFLAGFLAIGLSWFVYAAWLASGSSALPQRMGELFGGVSPMTLAFMSAFLGAIAGGLGALTGTMGRKLVG